MSHDFAYDYTIFPEADNIQFKALYKQIANIPEIKFQDTLIDVDGSITCRYLLDGRRILAYNDYEVDAIYVKSDADLSAYLTDYWSTHKRNCP